MALMLAWAGGLHLHFYTFSRQGKYLQFAMNRMETGPKFFLGDQVWGNMFWTLAWGVPVWTAYEVLYLWGAGNGYAPLIAFSSNPVWFILIFWIVLLWKGFHFYWVHRLIHWPRNA